MRSSTLHPASAPLLSREDRMSLLIRIGDRAAIVDAYDDEMLGAWSVPASRIEPDQRPSPKGGGLRVAPCGLPH